LLSERGSARSNQAVEQDRREVVTVDTDVKLARHWLQPSVAVPVQVQGTTVLPIPASERVMAQNESSVIQIEFRVVTNARPPFCR
jgi:hypothetical protein